MTTEKPTRKGLRTWSARALLAAFALFQLRCPAAPVAAGTRWWPVQAAPQAVVRTTDYDTFTPLKGPHGETVPPAFAAEHMLVESVAGLVAKAVNEGRATELVWIATRNPDYRDWYQRTVQRLHLEERGPFTPWRLVERYVETGLIKGYILYTYDFSPRGMSRYAKDMDLSVNVATSLAGVLEAILVEQGQEQQAKRLGLKRLLDARGKTQQWCFDTYKERFTRRLLCCQDPKAPHARALAIAHRALVLYGPDPPLTAAMEWLEPLSPVLGWNGGDEFKSTSLSTAFGQIQTATNWCMNLPFLMAGSEHAAFRKLPRFDPWTLDWNDKRSATAFVLTDGDNVQWLLGNFFRARERSYWNSPDTGRFPFTFSACLTQLVQLCPAAANHAVESRKPLTSLVEWGGGYYYPERFGSRRPNGRELLAQHARRTWENMRKTGTRIIGLNVHDLDSPQALKAYRIYAREMDGLLGILAFQYFPYEGGAGKVFWVRNRRGIEIPVVTARYSIWAGSNPRARSGTPARIAARLNENATTAQRAGKRNLDWVICHCWSWFRRAPGADKDAEDMPQTDAWKHGGKRGVTPVGWCVDRLSNEVHVVPIEELLWRIRMAHDPAQTRRALRADF